MCHATIAPKQSESTIFMKELTLFSELCLVMVTYRGEEEHVERD